MSRPPRTERSLPEWAALGLLCEGPRHGWAIARELASDGEIGRVFACTRPLVYRALGQLREAGLVEERGTTASDEGPTRTTLAATRTRSIRVQEVARVGGRARPRPAVRAHAQAAVPRARRYRLGPAASRAGCGPDPWRAVSRAAAARGGRLRPDARPLASLGRARGALVRGGAPRPADGRSGRLPAHRRRRSPRTSTSTACRSSRSPMRRDRRASRCSSHIGDVSTTSTASRTSGCSRTCTRRRAGIRRSPTFLDDRTHGTFATRSPRRPNPIGLSLARIVAVDDLAVVIAGIDLLAGTPVLDLKPYVPLFDAPDDADVRAGWFEGRAERVFERRSDDRFLPRSRR